MSVTKAGNGWQEVVRESGRGSRRRTRASATQKAADAERFFGAEAHPGIGHRRRARRACGTKKHAVAACRACATATIVTVLWMWVPRVDRYVDPDETGLLSPRSARTPARTGFDPARHRAPPTTLP